MLVTPPLHFVVLYQGWWFSRKANTKLLFHFIMSQSSKCMLFSRS